MSESLTFSSCAFSSDVHNSFSRALRAGKILTLSHTAQPCYGNPYDGERLLLLMALEVLHGSALIIIESSADLLLKWLDSDKQPLKNVSEFAKELTYVNIM